MMEGVMILLTGATGTTGSATVKQLQAANVPFRIMSRDIARARAQFGDGPDYVEGSFSEPASLDAAFEGITRLSLLCAFSEAMVELELGAVAAAKRAGIKHIVKMSAIKSAPDAPTTIRRWHGVIEQAINESGMAYTHLWPNAFMQNFRRFAPFIRDQGVFYAPVGDARISLVEIEDVAAVTVAALVEDGHAGQTYEITGPEAMSYAACAEILSDVLGKPVRFESVSDEAAHRALVEAGIGAKAAKALIEIDGLFREGFGAPVTDVVERVVGRKARSFRDFAVENANLFQ
jgi:uncharacterized protein YbjT (DUF2867 family)